MLTIGELTGLAKTRLRDAQALYSAQRYDAARYVAGYAVEVALKARICKTLKWAGFPSTRGEFEGLQSFKTHDLALLLRLSGRESKIRLNNVTEWSVVVRWNPEVRYVPAGAIGQVDAQRMIASAESIVRAL